VILKSNIHAIGLFFFNPGNRLKYNEKKSDETNMDAQDVTNRYKSTGATVTFCNGTLFLPYPFQPKHRIILAGRGITRQNASIYSLVQHLGIPSVIIRMKDALPSSAHPMGCRKSYS